MPDSVLLKATLSLLERSVPSASIFTALFILVSLGGTLYATHALLGCKTTISSAWIMSAPFTLLGAAGIVGPIAANALKDADESSLSKAGILPLMDESALYVEALCLVLLFAAASAMCMGKSQRILSSGRQPKARLWAVAASCGIEAAAALGLALVSVAKLLGQALAFALQGPLFFYAVAIITIKLLEQLFILAYAEILASSA